MLFLGRSIKTHLYLSMKNCKCDADHLRSYSAKLLCIAVYICRVESLGQCVYGAGVREPSFALGIMWHVARTTAVAARVLSLRCGYAIHTSL